jgi:large subunit ribosomal protein L21
MAYAIIKTGGKQYKVSVGDQLDVDQIDAEAAEGSSVTFTDVMAHGEGASVVIGTPTVTGATVSAKVVALHKGPKVIAFKYKRRKGFHKKKGFRHNHTRVEITAINA